MFQQQVQVSIATELNTQVMPIKKAIADSENLSMRPFQCLKEIVLFGSAQRKPANLMSSCYTALFLYFLS